MSPAWRKRSKSISHDNALYRIGVRKNEHGESTDVINRVPHAMINAMSKLRLNSIKREPTAYVDVGLLVFVGVAESIDRTGNVKATEVVSESELHMAYSNPRSGTDDAGGKDLNMPDSPGAHRNGGDEDDKDDGYGDERAIDMTNSASVYGRIRIYLDVERKVTGGHIASSLKSLSYLLLPFSLTAQATKPPRLEIPLRSPEAAACAKHSHTVAA